MEIETFEQGLTAVAAAGIAFNSLDQMTEKESNRKFRAHGIVSIKSSAKDEADGEEFYGFGATPADAMVDLIYSVKNA